MPLDFVALAVASFAIDGLVWGIAGYCVFRLLGGRRWWVGILATIQRCADMKLVNEKIEWLEGFAFRGPKSLEVTFRAV